MKVDNHIHSQSPHKHTVKGGNAYGNKGPSNVFNTLTNEGATQSSNLKYNDMSDVLLPSGGENTGGASPFTNYIGNNEAINIMPPFIVVYTWKRLS